MKFGDQKLITNRRHITLDESERFRIKHPYMFRKWTIHLIIVEHNGFHLYGGPGYSGPSATYEISHCYRSVFDTNLRTMPESVAEVVQLAMKEMKDRQAADEMTLRQGSCI